MHISEQKRQLRNQITERIDALTEDQRHAEGRTLSRLLLQKLPSTLITICAYYPLKSEVDIRLLLRECMRRGDTVYLPVFADADKKMIYRKVDHLQDLSPGDLNIPEPREHAEELGDKQVDIVLIPGRAFDIKGNRLGRGSGGYDTWLERYKKQYPETPLWGTCLLCQIVSKVPVEDHDVRMDAVVTAKEFYEVV